jgi:5-methylcytosine-specific restriction enzyme A
LIYQILTFVLAIIVIAVLMLFIQVYRQQGKQLEAVTKKKVRRGIDKDIRAHILKRDNYTCQNCGRTDCCSPHIDHIKPVALGGTNDLENLQVLCANCNLTKGRRHITSVNKNHVEHTP